MCIRDRYIIEANLWIKKYFIEFSIGEYSLDVIKGRNLNIFNSNLAHIIILELLLIAMAKLIISISLNLNRGLKIIILIRNYIFLLTINSSMLLKAFIKERVAEIVLNCKFKNGPTLFYFKGNFIS